MAWSFVLTDYARNPIGEVRNASERTAILGLSRIDTARCKVRIDNPLVPYLLSTDPLLKVLDGTTLRFWGPVSSVELAKDESAAPTLVVTASSPAWRLAKRLGGKSTGGTQFTGADRAAIVKQLIDTTNAESDTQIQTTAVSSGSTVSFLAGPYQPISQILQTLSQSIDGFDWYIQPVEGVSGKIGTFVAAAIVGGQRPDCVFEYSVGKSNIRSFNLQRSWDTLINQAFHIPDDGPSSPSGVVPRSDAASIGTRGLYEETIDSQNVTDAGLRDALVSEAIRIRKEPKLVLTFQPDFPDPGRPGRVPVFGTDYSIGDFVRARVNFRDTNLVDGLLRVYGVTITLNNEGKATTTPLLVDEDGSAT